MILGVHHTAISTPDIDRLAEFYIRHLGFRDGFGMEWAPGSRPQSDELLGLTGSGARLRMLRGANGFIELFQFSAPAPPPPGGRRGINEYGYTHICLLVDDLAAQHRDLVAAGIAFHGPPQDRGPHKAAYFRDPDGNVIELLQLVDAAGPMQMARLAEP